jgi:hypothetical protein
VPIASKPNTCTAGQGEIANGRNESVPVMLRSITSTSPMIGRNQASCACQESRSQLAASQGDAIAQPTTVATASIVPDQRQWKKFQTICALPEPSA